MCSFDWIKFCKVNNVPAVIKDIYGKEHDLIAEGITTIFTKSMFKMWNHYDSWDEYKQIFKSCGAKFGKTNYEEDEIDNTTLNYQYIQTLTDVTDAEIKALTKNEHSRILNITKNRRTMIQTLKGNVESENPYKAAIAYYPEFLWDAYTRTQLKDIRKRMLLDAKSGKIKMINKRLFAIPDLYAACEYYFQHIENPEGLLKKDEVATKLFVKYGKVDILRSPHLYMEHFISNVSTDPKVYEWFATNGIVTSCHSLISRVLQFDVDGDQLNVIADPLFVSIAERNIKKYDVIPLFYDAHKAQPEVLSYETIFNGLKRAHDYSSGGITSIGEISNMLTKLWNKNKPDRIAAAWLARFNNDVIDGAKTGEIDHYKDYPAVASRINKATGGKTGRLPAWFEFSSNGRRSPAPGKKKRQYLSPNNSTMNRICKMFEDIGNINLRTANVDPFNWQMLLSGPCKDNRLDICKLFCDIDQVNTTNIIESQEFNYITDREAKAGYDLLAKMITDEMTKKYGSLEETYPYIVKFLFAGEALGKSAHKQMFWRVYGQIALRNIIKNMENYSTCEICKMKYPAWVETHSCPQDIQGFYDCVDCGAKFNRMNSRQCRCPECQEGYRRTAEQTRKKKKYKEMKEKDSEFTTSLVSRLNPKS